MRWSWSTKRDETRATLAQLLERVTLDPATAIARLHYQVGQCNRG
jgi:hypothetical protein